MFSVRFPVHHFNWVPSPWQQVQEQRAKIAAANSRFDNNQSAFSNGLFSALTNDSSTSANNVMQEAINRLQGDGGSATSSTASTSSLGSLLDSVA